MVTNMVLKYFSRIISIRVIKNFFCDDNTHACGYDMYAYIFNPNILTLIEVGNPCSMVI